MAFIDYIDESNKLTLNKPVNSDKIYYSELNEWFTNNAFRSFSIKYVVDGMINYLNGNKEFVVNSGNFLIASQQPYVKAFFQSQKATRSICIDICPESIAEAYTILTTSKDHNLDNYLLSYFETPHFFEHIVSLKNSLIQNEVSLLVNGLEHKDAVVNGEWFLHMVEKIILQELPNHRYINKVVAKKHSTKKEIFERVRAGKGYMDDSFSINPEIKLIASECSLSPYHFFRCFKQIYQISPYQYMMQKRLQLAVEQMKQEKRSLSEIAAGTGFPDIYTFSKAFKKKYGVSPRGFLQQVCGGPLPLEI